MTEPPPDPPDEPAGDASTSSPPPDLDADPAPASGEAEPDVDRDPLSLARRIADAYRNGPAPAHQPRRRRPPTGPRRRTREDPVALSDLLGQVAQEHGWDERLAAQRVFSDWSGVVGPEIAAHSKVSAFEGHVVHVDTDSTAWATQLRLLAPRIVAKLNEELGQGSVLRIEVSGPRPPSWKKGARSVRGARGPRDTYG